MVMKKLKGSALVLFVGGLTCLLLFLALVVDVGVWYSRRAQVQLTGDIAVLSAMGNVNLDTMTVAQQKQFVIDAAKAIITNNGYDTSRWTITPEQNTPLNPLYVNRATITTTQPLPTFFWTVVTNRTPNMVVRSVAEALRVTAPTPNCGFIALNTIHYGGGGGAKGYVDSYNSNNGAYSAESHTINDCGASGGSKSAIFDYANATGCSNGAISYNGNIAQFGSLYSHSTISLSGGAALLDGNLTASSAIDPGASTVCGQIKANSSVPHFTLPTVDATGAIASNNDANIYWYDKKGNLQTLGNANLYNAKAQEVIYLPAGGTYYFNGLSMTGQAQLVIDNTTSNAKTTIYMDGDMKIAGGVGFANQANASAQNLQILGTSNCQEITIGGNSAFYADILAPSASVNLNGTAGNYGRIRAWNIDLSGTGQFTFDEALGTKGFSTDTLNIRVHLVE
jgi:hypothetical protein